MAEEERKRVLQEEGREEEEVMKCFGIEEQEEERSCRVSARR